MTISFETALAAVIDALPAALADQPALDHLKRFCRVLPPFYAGGFECRLSESGAPVEVQLCLRRDDPLHRRQIEALLDTLAQEGNAMLLGFLHRWFDGEVAEVSEIWLEFDYGKDGWSRPSIFIDCPQHSGDHAASLRSVSDLLDTIIGRKGWARSAATVSRCIDRLPDGAFVSAVGVMLGRDKADLRLNVKRLCPDTLAPYLRAVGWPGSHDALAKSMNALIACDRFTLGLDVGEGVAPGISLECMVNDRFEKNASPWAHLLDLLVRLGLCRPAARDAVLEWPRSLTPLTTSDYPFDLVGAGMLIDPAHLDFLRLAINHVKIRQLADGTRDAKAYLWFGYHEEAPRAANDSATVRQWRAARDRRPLLEQVKQLFADRTDLFFDYLGRTFRAWLFEAEGDVRSSNLAMARRAGLQPGWRVLDAGCGVAGPAIDIAGAIDVTIDGITICPRQVEIGTMLIEQANLAYRISLQLGDYHYLPWPEGSFDAAMFLESSNHTEDPVALFDEIYRVLRPGGVIFIFDSTIPERDSLSPDQIGSLESFDDCHADRTRSLTETRRALEEVGFRDVTPRDMSGQVSSRRWDEACWTDTLGARRMTPFGAAHVVKAPRDGQAFIRCGEIRAIKPKSVA